MLLYEKKDEDGIKNFFNEVYELYLKVNIGNISFFKIFLFRFY